MARSITTLRLPPSACKKQKREPNVLSSPSSSQQYAAAAASEHQVMASAPRLDGRVWTAMAQHRLCLGRSGLMPDRKLKEKKRYDVWAHWWCSDLPHDVSGDSCYVDSNESSDWLIKFGRWPSIGSGGRWWSDREDRGGAGLRVLSRRSSSSDGSLRGLRSKSADDMLLGCRARVPPEKVASFPGFVVAMEKLRSSPSTDIDGKVAKIVAWQSGWSVVSTTD